MRRINRVRVAIVLIAVLFVQPLLAAVPHELAQDGLGQEILRADWPAILREARMGQQANPDHPVARWLVGYASLAREEYRGAMESFMSLGPPEDVRVLSSWVTSLTARTPRNPIVKMLEGDALARSGRFEEALVALTEAVRLDPHSPLIRAVRGAIAVLAGKPDAAKADFQRAVELDPAFADAHSGLGLAHIAKGEFGPAIESLTTAIEQAPDLAVAFNARGVAFLHAGDPDRALEDLEHAARAQPGFVTAANNLRLARWYRTRLTLRRGVDEQEKLAGVLRQQIIVIDIPGIESQGENRPAQWGPVLMGSQDFARHNIRHAGALGFNLQQPEPGRTATLSREWNLRRDAPLLDPLLVDVRAGRNAYVKIDQNIKAPTYLVGGKPREGEWVRSVADWMSDRIRQINPNALIIVNAHSKGTLDAHGLNLSRVDRVILASDRGSASDAQRLVTRYPATQFTLIAGDRDFAHGVQGFMRVNAPNVAVINLKSGGLLPTTVHGQVTDPTYRGVYEIKTSTGITRFEGTLGRIVQQTALPLSPVITAALDRTRDPTSYPTLAPPRLLYFPPDKFGGAGVSGLSYRMTQQQSATIGADHLKGVGMPVTELVIGKHGDRADLGAIFSAATGEAAEDGAFPDSLVCPFLIFAGMPVSD
jgi:tetratricopeptide (TPR) repeat protein